MFVQKFEVEPRGGGEAAGREMLALEDGLAAELRMEPQNQDEAQVNGVELTIESPLANLRTARSFYEETTYGGKRNCFQRVLNHQGVMQLETIQSLAKEMVEQEIRVRKEVTLAVLPGEASHARRNLTHVPYATWCPHCVAHGAKPDRRERTAASKEGASTTATRRQSLRKMSSPRQRNLVDGGEQSDRLCLVCYFAVQETVQIGSS